MQGKNKPIRLVISGCCGRMGSLLVEEALKGRVHFELVGGVESPRHPQKGQPMPGNPQVKITDDLKSILSKADLLVEFTTPEVSLAHAQIAAQAKVPVIIGTTGFSGNQMGELRNLSREIPIFWSPNMSIGVVILRKAIRSLFDLYRRFGLEKATAIRISETHHAQKKDRPSGTAKLLAREIQEVTGRSIPEDQIEAKREGEVVGIHRVTFDSGLEQVVLEHTAFDRRVFAQGALVVARHFHTLWKQPGFFGMDDFLETVTQGKKKSR